MERSRQMCGAPEEVAEQIDVFIREGQIKLDKHRGHPERRFVLDNVEWRAAATELINICEGQ